MGGLHGFLALGGAGMGQLGIAVRVVPRLLGRHFVATQRNVVGPSALDVLLVKKLCN